MLLQAVLARSASALFGRQYFRSAGRREPLAPALQQVERTERILKSIWRERNQFRGDWN